MLPIVKTVYLLRRKSCARFELNFSIILLCQVKIPDENNIRCVDLLGKNTKKPLVHLLATDGYSSAVKRMIERIEDLILSRLVCLIT